MSTSSAPPKAAERRALLRPRNGLIIEKISRSIMGELVRDVGVLGPTVSEDDEDGFVGVLVYGEGRVGVLEECRPVDVRAEGEAESPYRLDGDPADAAAAALVCLDGPMFTLAHSLMKRKMVYVRSAAAAVEKTVMQGGTRVCASSRNEVGVVKMTTCTDDAV